MTTIENLKSYATISLAAFTELTAAISIYGLSNSDSYMGITIPMVTAALAIPFIADINNPNTEPVQLESLVIDKIPNKESIRNLYRSNKHLGA